MRAHEVVDGVLRGRAVVVGSLPPDGRDLDVLVAADEVAALERALRAAGFERYGDAWLRFANLTAEIVDVIRAGDWGLAPAQERELFADAVALGDSRRLARPAAHHALLVLARGLSAEPQLSERRRQRLRAALAEDPDALARARRRARAWGVEAQLEALASGAAGPASRRRVAPAGARARLGAICDLLRGRRRGTVIALSGLDGAGKSTQAAALSAALGRLGHEVAIEWTRLGLRERFWARAAQAERTAALRRRSALARQLSATALTLDQAWSQRRWVSGRLARGQVVICDRYTLDSVVSLRCLVGGEAALRLQRAILRALTRRPLRAYLLDVPAETAWERKREHGLQRLRRQRALYLAEHRDLGVDVLDGAAPPAELASRIACDCWAALQRRPPQPRHPDERGSHLRVTGLRQIVMLWSTTFCGLIRKLRVLKEAGAGRSG